MRYKYTITYLLTYLLTYVMQVNMQSRISAAKFLQKCIDLNKRLISKYLLNSVHILETKILVKLIL